MIDKCIHEELRAKFNPDGSDLRKMQLRMLEMLKFLDKVCRDNGLEYWIDSGTLLGAFRHKGFIPWDDDIDVCMKKKDLKKFEKIVIDMDSCDFVIQNHKTDNGYFGFWTVLRDLKSEYIQNDGLHNRRIFKGLQIDIFPVETRISHNLFKIAKSLQYRCIDLKLRNNTYSNVVWRFRFLKYILYPIFSILSLLIHRDYYLMSYGCSFSTRRYKKNIYPLTDIIFEDHLFRAPNNTQLYLKDIYGNNLDIPSVENIRNHNVKIKFL